MICTISGSVAVFKDNFDSPNDVILGYLNRGDIVVEIQTFKKGFKESFCVTRFGVGFLTTSKIIEFQNSHGDK